MYYHIRISTKSNKTHDETKVDLSEEQLLERFIKPYELGNSIIINGKTITLDDLTRIMISKSEKSSSDFIYTIKYEDRNSTVISLGGPSYEWRAADRAKDITDDLIKGPIGYKKDKQIKNNSFTNASNKKVFIVHGHDEKLKSDIESFLYNIHLEPVILHKKPDEGLSIIEKFEKNTDVKFALILLTPDDVACSYKNIDSKDLKQELKPRARQNVIFEFGYFIGKLGRKNVCCIFEEGVELPSDINGLLYKKIENNIESVAFSLIKELKAAGLEPVI